jgi:hypothetical protein
VAETLLLDLNDPIVSQINHYRNLLTRDISRVDARAPVVELGAAIKQDQTVTMGGVRDVHPLEITQDSDLFRLTFPNPVCFAVTDEMFATAKGDDSSGGWIKMFRGSAFLEFVRETTWAKDEFPGPLVHVQINTLDHRIDVVTAHAPDICRF